MHIRVENMFQEVRKQQTPNIGFLAREGTENEENASFVKCLVFAYFCVYRGVYFRNPPKKGPP